MLDLWEFLRCSGLYFAVLALALNNVFLRPWKSVCLGEYHADYIIKLKFVTIEHIVKLLLNNISMTFQVA